MNKTEVFTLLKANQNDRGLENWEKLGPGRDRLKSFGIGLTQLRKLAKQIGRDPQLAKKLWKTDTYDAKIIALLIDDPKLITREQAETQVDELEQGYLAHVFSSCGATLAKAPFVVELAVDWVAGEDPMRQRCGYGLLYEISKSKRKDAPDDAFFLAHIHRIRDSFDDETPAVRGAMGLALMGMGKRNAKLNKVALKVARSIGPIDMSSDGDNCEPFDVVKHLEFQVA